MKEKAARGEAWSVRQTVIAASLEVYRHRPPRR